MKINSQELLLLNKKQNLRRLNTQPTAPSGDVPVSNPENTLKALDAMALNNMAFQGRGIKFSPEMLKKGAKNLVLGATALFTMGAAQSCTPEWWGQPSVIIEGDTINVDVNIEIDISAITALLQELIDLQKMNNEEAQAILDAIEKGQMSMDEFFKLVLGLLGSIDGSLKNITEDTATWTQLLQEIVNNGKISNEKAQEILDQLSKLYKAFVKGEISDAEFKAQVLAYMTSSSENQETIILLLEQNGMREEEAKAYLEKLLQEVQDGKKSAEDAYNELMKLLNNIYGQLQGMTDVLKLLVEQGKISNEKADQTNAKITEFFEAYQKGQATAEEFYKNVFNYMTSDSELQKLMLEQLIKNGMNQEEANAYLAVLIANVESGNITAQDAYNEIIKLLNSIYGKLKDMTSLLKTLVKQGDLSNEKADETNAKITEFYNAYLNGQASAEEFYKNVFNYMTSDYELQKLMLEQLMKNGMTQEKANAYLEKLLKEVQDGKISASEAYNKLMDILSGISIQLQGMTDLLKLLVEQGVLSNEKADQTNAKITEFYNAYLNGQATAEEFYKNVFNYMTSDSELQKLMLEQLTKNGMTQEKANAYLEKLLKEVQDGKISASEAYSKLMDILNGISIQLQGMTDLLKLLVEQGALSNEKADETNAKITEFYNAYLNGQASAEEFYKNVFNYMTSDSELQKLMLEQLMKNGMTQEKANAYLEKLLKEVQDGKISASEAYNKLIEILNGISGQLQGMTDLLKLLVEQGVISNEKADQTNAKITEFYNAYLNGQATAEEFYKNVFNYMTGDYELQKLMLEQLTKNGMSQDQANRYLESLISKVESGNMTAQEAYAEIIKLLNGIQNTLDNILAKLGEISDKITENHEEYMNAKDKELDMLDKLYYQGKVDQSYFEDLYQNQNTMIGILGNMSANTDSLLVSLNDPAKYEKFIADLKNLMPSNIDYEKFQEMFDMLGLTIEDVVNMRAKDLIGEINDFKNTYIKTEAEHAKKLDTIISKISYIATFLPNLDQGDIENAIKDLVIAIRENTGSINENTEVVGNGLNNINSKLDTIIEKLDDIFDNTAGLTKYFSEQNENWTNALGNLEKANQMLDKILKEQQITNSTLNSFKAEFKDIKEAQNLSNSYLYILTQKANDLEEAIKAIDVDVDVVGGMTRDEFLDAMEIRDAKMAAEFKKFIEDYNFDNIPGDVQTIKDFLAEINNKVETQKDYSAQLDRIIALEGDILSFLQNADFSDPDALAKLDEIITLIKNFKCNCECGKDSGSTNEGVEDLEDIFGNN